MFQNSASDNVQVFTAAQRLFTRDTTSEERKRLWKAARKIHRERKAGAQITMRTLCLRLLIEGLGLPHDQAAEVVDAALSSDELPAELRASMN